MLSTVKICSFLLGVATFHTISAVPAPELSLEMVVRHRASSPKSLNLASVGVYDKPKANIGA